MTLFEECKEALKAYFGIIKDTNAKVVVETLYSYLFYKREYNNKTVFVVTDDIDIPIL